LLDLCDYLSSNTGNSVQRLVCYFSGALRERTNKETGRLATSKGFRKEQSFNICEAMMSPSLRIMEFYKQNSFSRVLHLDGIQAIVEMWAWQREFT
jgi:DELLA protein